MVSRRRIRRIMKENFLFSSYQESQFKVYPKSSVHNKEDVENIVDRKFTNREYREVLISDLTYLNVNNRTAYLCVISDLFNREILGYSTGFTKTPGLVLKAFSCIKDLSNVKYFHTDRGCEFKNGEIDRLLFENDIMRSLSHPGVPYDNACAETLYKTIKIEFVKKRKFKNMDELNLEFFNYMVWYNFKRLHSSLDYLSPV